MRVFRINIASLFVFVAFGQAAAALSATITVADYQGDFQGPTPTAGWSYQVNSGGPIGTASNYADLGWYNTGSQYNLDGSGPTPIGSNYMRLLGDGTGHPGPGTSQGEATDRYAIAAYTIQSSDIAGYLLPATFDLTNSSLTAGTGPITVEVYVNNTQIGSAVDLPKNASTNFDRMLGNLTVGDTVFVAVGPDGSHSDDKFSNLDFSIQFTAELAPPTPEPSTAMLLGLGVAGFSSMRRRKRRS